MQRLRQDDGGAGVAAHVLVHGGKAEIGGRVVLEGRGAVDDGVDAAELRDDLGQQIAHGGLVGLVGAEGRAGAGQPRAVGHGSGRVFERVAVMHGDLPAILGQRERNLTAQALGGTGDKNRSDGRRA